MQFPVWRKISVGYGIVVIAASEKAKAIESQDKQYDFFHSLKIVLVKGF